jgi:membrane protease YdiL (CAAX protease family)
VTAFLVYFAFPSIVLAVLLRTGFYTWVYGPDFPLPDLRKPAEKVPEMVQTRWNLWVAFFAFPFQVAFIPGLLYLGSGTRPYQLGLTRHRLVQNITLAFLGWLVLTPLVTGINVVVEGVWQWLQNKPEVHPLAQLGLHHPTPVEWVILLLLAAVFAPVLEELVFRGLLQTWFASRSWGGHVAIAGALFLAYDRGWDKAGIWPVAFVLAMLPGYVYVSRATWSWLPYPSAAQAIYGTSLLFALAHAGVWPTPIPLFVLGLGLGYLAHRTQSLVGPMLLHALFNAVACVVLLFYPPTPAPVPPNGTAVTSAAQRPSAVSTSSAVPGSWLPRRTYASAMAVPTSGDTTDDVTLPTSWPSRSSRAPAATGRSPLSFRPTSDRFTWP